jgi:hypothetical protein
MCACDITTAVLIKTGMRNVQICLYNNCSTSGRPITCPPAKGFSDGDRPLLASCLNVKHYASVHDVYIKEEMID